MAHAARDTKFIRVTLLHVVYVREYGMYNLLELPYYM